MKTDPGLAMAPMKAAAFAGIEKLQPAGGSPTKSRSSIGTAL